MPRTRSGKPPGRPKAFCEEKALEAAMLVFADKGFKGTSLSDLTKAMGINRFSLYDTYGNKEELFLKAMERYNGKSCQRLSDTLSVPSAREGITQLLRGAVMNFTNKSGIGCCFVTQAPLASGQASEKTRRHVAAMRASVEKSIRERLERAVNEGELPRDTFSADLARFFAVTIQGFALQAQHGGTQEELMRVVDVAMGNWPKAQKLKQ